MPSPARNGSPARKSRGFTICWKICASRAASPCRRWRIADDDALNAFATGLNEKQYSITVTRGLMNALNDAELEAVLGHELTHIRNGDVRMLVIAVVIAGVISFFGETGLPAFLPERHVGRRPAVERRATARAAPGLAIIIALVIIVVVWILSIVIRFALSRQREYLADAGSVELTKNPDAMISALRKIEGRGEIRRRQFGRDGDVHRQSARGLFQYFRHPSVGRRACRGAGEIRRRSRSRAAGVGSARSHRHKLTISRVRKTLMPVRGATRRNLRRKRARGARSRARHRDRGAQSRIKRVGCRLGRAD